MLLQYCSAWSVKHFELPENQLLPGQKVFFLHSYSVWKCLSKLMFLKYLEKRDGIRLWKIMYGKNKMVKLFLMPFPGGLEKPWEDCSEESIFIIKIAKLETFLPSVTAVQKSADDFSKISMLIRAILKHLFHQVPIHSWRQIMVLGTLFSSTGHKCLSGHRALIFSRRKDKALGIHTLFT